MTKRPDSIDVAKLYHAILRDYVAAYPTDHEDAMRDSKRVALQSRSRGLGFFTLDLPEIGKVLDRALSLGRLDRSALPHMRRRWKGSVIPKLFSGLWIRLFDHDGLLRSDIDSTVVFFLRTLLYAGKKARLECTPQRVNDAIKEYYDVETSMRNEASPIWDDPHSMDWKKELYTLPELFERSSQLGVGAPLLRPLEERPVGMDLEALWQSLRSAQLFAGRTAALLGTFEPEDVRGKHGPGAVSEELLDGNKYTFPTWSPRLEYLFPFERFGVNSIDSFLQNSTPIPQFPREREHHSKLIDVPKTQKGPRLIASEPVCHQWIQQGLARLLVEKVMQTSLRHSLDFHSQEKSRQAALEASLTGKRATIDLSSASDRLSLAVVQAIFKSNYSLLQMMSACRTRYLYNPLDKKHPKLIKLKKFASMGSALTFPVQSIVFAILAVGVGKSLNPKASDDELCKEVRVFGDDIIVPVEWVGTLISLMTALGLKVNTSKTFTVGNFRESCGMDAFQGSEVTPAYIRWLSTELDSDSAVGYVAVANNFFMKGCWHAAQYLESAAPWVSRLPAVAAHVAALGRATFCNGIDPSLRKRWDDAIQQWVVPILRVKPKKGRNVTNEGPNGFMEYVVRNYERLGDHQFLDDDEVMYSWAERLFPRESYMTIGEMVLKPPKGSRASLRRAWVPAEILLRG